MRVENGGRESKAKGMCKHWFTTTEASKRPDDINNRQSHRRCGCEYRVGYVLYMHVYCIALTYVRTYTLAAALSVRPLCQSAPLHGYEQSGCSAPRRVEHRIHIRLALIAGGGTNTKRARRTALCGWNFIQRRMYRTPPLE